jgi:hypothetical protein
MWVSDENDSWGRRLEVKKRAVNFQKRRSLAWLWTYVKVLEYELPRMQSELQTLAGEVQRLRENFIKIEKSTRKSWMINGENDVS